MKVIQKIVEACCLFAKHQGALQLTQSHWGTFILSFISNMHLQTMFKLRLIWTPSVHWLNVELVS